MTDDKAIDLASLRKVLAAEITAMSEDLESSSAPAVSTAPAWQDRFVASGKGVAPANLRAAESETGETPWQRRFVASGKMTAPANPRAAESGTGRAAWQRRFVASGKVAPAPQRG